MSIELRQAAQQALEALIEASGCVTNSTFVKVMMARDSLVEALSHQPATPEPVLFIHPDTFAMNNAQVGAWKPGYELTSYIPLYTHPVPSVPADVARDAIASVREHYRGTDWGKAAECVCDAIDAAMLAAKEASA